MKFLADDEEYLIYAKIAGSLNAEEEKLCEKLLRNKEAAREIYQRLLENLPAEDVATSFSRFKDPVKWLDSHKLHQELPVLKWYAIFRRPFVAAAAAALLVLVAGVWWLLAKEGEQKMVTQTSAKSIRLILAGGQQINLSREKGTISSGQAQLSNSGTALRYMVSPTGATGMNQLITPSGMDYQITLSDSTKIWLNAATRLDFPFAFTGNTREVTIEGEAYLEVAKMPGKPFLVHLPKSTVEVLGTSFNVNSYDNEVEQVALVEGIVRMKAGNQQLDLRPGKAGVFQNAVGLQETTFDLQKVLAWRQGVFYFRNATVEEISRVIPRWYGRETKVDNPMLVSRRFTGVVDKKQPISIFQDNLKAISGIDTYLDADSVLHFK